MNWSDLLHIEFPFHSTCQINLDCWAAREAFDLLFLSKESFCQTDADQPLVDQVVCRGGQPVPLLSMDATRRGLIHILIQVRILLATVSGVSRPLSPVLPATLSGSHRAVRPRAPAVLTPTRAPSVEVQDVPISRALRIGDTGHELVFAQIAEKTADRPIRAAAPGGESFLRREALPAGIAELSHDNEQQHRQRRDVADLESEIQDARVPGH
jgi:hypothetical protein